MCPSFDGVRGTCGQHHETVWMVLLRLPRNMCLYLYGGPDQRQEPLGSALLGVLAGRVFA